MRRDVTERNDIISPLSCSLMMDNSRTVISAMFISIYFLLNE